MNTVLGVLLQMALFSKVACSLNLTAEAGTCASTRVVCVAPTSFAANGLQQADGNRSVPVIKRS